MVYCIVTYYDDFITRKITNSRKKPLNATNVELVKKFLFALHREKVNHPELLQLEFLGKLCKGNKYAIVIGISDYPGTENNLNYTDDNATDVKTTLMEKYGFRDKNIRLLQI